MTSRRTFLGGTGAAGAAAIAAALPRPAHAHEEPFFAENQAGIATPQQANAYLAVFDITASRRAEVVGVLKAWTAAAARLAAGLPADACGTDLAAPPGDSGDAIGLDPSRLTLTFGFGPELFTYQGKDRFGLAARRPAALADLPFFPGDQLDPQKTGGSLVVQACADDPQVTFHAVRQLARIADGAVAPKWVQAGFTTAPRVTGTARNLMGFKDGTMNPNVKDAAVMDKHIWVGAEGPAWMRGGSYMVARRIRIALEHWDKMKLGFQEQVFGRKKYSGAPLGGRHENDPLDLAAVDADGNPVIPANAHARLAAPALNDGAQILRRAYSYDDGMNFTAERWPPWRQANEYDAGLLFIVYQQDPRAGFTRLFEKMSRIDALNQFTTHVGSGLFACPGGVRKGGYIGQGLFESA